MRIREQQNELLNQSLLDCKNIETIDLLIELSDINQFLNREHSLLRKLVFIKSDWNFREKVKLRRKSIMDELNKRN
jgi:hypothetical protein